MAARSSPSLASIEVMLLVEQQFAMDVLGTAVQGFGVGRMVKSRSIDAAISAFNVSAVDVIIIDYSTPGANQDIVKRLRRELPEGRNSLPIVVLSAHAGESLVKECVAAGASFVICKPYNAETLLSRLLWLAQDPRPFITNETYIGPDRRQRNLGIPPNLKEGRRASDLPADVSDKSGFNMDQTAIDAMLKPQRVNLL
jgi:CheY-like chemotaxis protein